VRLQRQSLDLQVELPAVVAGALESVRSCEVPAKLPVDGSPVLRKIFIHGPLEVDCGTVHLFRLSVASTVML
jgi:hypothetical protein